MSGIVVFDCLSEARLDDGPTAGADLTRRRTAMAEKLIAAALADRDRIREYEQVSCPEDIGAEEVPVTLLESIQGLYRDWAADAEQVASRATDLVRLHGVRLTALPHLEDAIGSVRARLNLNSERLPGSIKQARGGAFVPSKELRDELRARVRA